MRLWAYQHSSVLHTLQRGERYLGDWACVPNLRWQNAYRWMLGQMNQHGIETGLHPPIWTWHSVNRLGGKPDMDCANALLSEDQISQGIDLLELEAPDHLALASCYGNWNRVLDHFIDGDTPGTKAAADCFAVQLKPRRGRPLTYFPSIQVCLPYIDPDWLISSETLNITHMLEERRIAMENALKFLEQYKSMQWEFNAKGALIVKLEKK